MKNTIIDEQVIELLNTLPKDGNTTLFAHMTSEGDVNYISYFLEANSNNLATMIIQLMNDKGFKTSMFQALSSYFALNSIDRILFMEAMKIQGNIDAASMN
jgi:hypothetical protein